MPVVLRVRNSPVWKVFLALEKITGPGCRGVWVLVLAKDADQDGGVGIAEGLAKVVA